MEDKVPHRASRLLLAVVLAAGPALAACSAGSEESAPDLLARAKKVIDEASSVHFALSSENAPDTGTGLLGGEGDVVRPASFEGTLQVLVAGSSVDVQVVSVDDTVYAQLPFTSGFSVVDPAQFGVGDPADVLDTEAGISQFLEFAKSPKLGKERRVGGEVVREVTADIPGNLVEQVLTSQDPSQPVHAVFAIASDSGELRRAQLTGPFFTADEDATYTIELSDFGADVEITAPPTS
jgi:lipoprotein LprG